MIVYVNGDSHSAGAEVANPYCFAEDDPLYWGLGRKPHPDNERASYGCLLANHLFAVLHCDAESASSNDRIIRTTREYLATMDKPDIVIIGWATWEREEWLHEGKYYQVTASGSDTVPPELETRYKEWVVKQAESNVINQRTIDAHTTIYNFHKELESQEVKHIFFSTFHSFANIKNLQHLGTKEQDWGSSYIKPYDDSMTYYNFLINRGYPTATPNSYHLGAQGHEAWANYLLPLVQNKIG